MKKFSILTFIALSLFSFSSCEDDSKDPLPAKVYGQFVKLDIEDSHKQLDYNDIDNTYFGGILSTPSSNIVKFELMIRRTNAAGQLTSDYVPFMTITSFPYDLRITPAMIADALDLQISDLKDGEFYRWYGYSYDVNGNVATYRNLSTLNRTVPAVEQGYRFNTELTSSPDAIYDNRIIPE